MSRSTSFSSSSSLFGTIMLSNFHSCDAQSSRKIMRHTVLSILFLLNYWFSSGAFFRGVRGQQEGTESELFSLHLNDSNSNYMKGFDMFPRGGPFGFSRSKRTFIDSSRAYMRIQTDVYTPYVPIQNRRLVEAFPFITDRNNDTYTDGGSTIPNVILSLPLVIYAHGRAPGDSRENVQLLESLARSGARVIAAQRPSPLGSRDEEYLRGAIDMLRILDEVEHDPRNTFLVGFSRGGGAVMKAVEIRAKQQQKDDITGE